MKLVTFDKSKNISYFGECKLQFNGPDKCLNLKLLDKDLEETMTATFDRIFLCKNNLLCCLDHSSDESLIIVFSTKEKCEQIFDAIVKVKLRQSQTSENDAINEEEIFKENFFISLLKQIHSAIDGHLDLRIIVLDFVNSLENDERICYLNILAEILLVPTLLETKMDINNQIDIEPVSSASEIASNTSKLSNSSKYPMRKRSVINISYKESDDDDNEENNESLRKKSRLSKPSSDEFCLDEPSPKNSPSDVTYDIVEYIPDDGKMDKKLLIFTSKERKQCYEFIYIHRVCHFRCIKCYAKKKKIYIKSILHHDGSRSFNFNVENHICEPINYLPENYQSSLIIKTPNFEYVKLQKNGKMIPHVIIFDSDDRSLCYKFSLESARKSFCCFQCQYLGIKHVARFIQYDGKNAIELQRLKHICQPQKYIG